MADGVMHRMTVGMVETTRRKTRFPTVGATIHAKAKPPSAATAFCIYFITLIDAINPNRSLEKVSCHFLMTAIRKIALYMLDS